MRFFVMNPPITATSLAGELTANEVAQGKEPITYHPDPNFRWDQDTRNPAYITITYRIVCFCGKK